MFGINSHSSHTSSSSSNEEHEKVEQPSKKSKPQKLESRVSADSVTHEKVQNTAFKNEGFPATITQQQNNFNRSNTYQVITSGGLPKPKFNTSDSLEEEFCQKWSEIPSIDSNMHNYYVDECTDSASYVEELRVRREKEFFNPQTVFNNFKDEFEQAQDGKSKYDLTQEGEKILNKYLIPRSMATPPIVSPTENPTVVVNVRSERQRRMLEKLKARKNPQPISSPKPETKTDKTKSKTVFEKVKFETPIVKDSKPVNLSVENKIKPIKEEPVNKANNFIGELETKISKQNKTATIKYLIVEESTREKPFFTARVTIKDPAKMIVENIETSSAIGQGTCKQKAKQNAAFNYLNNNHEARTIAAKEKIIIQDSPKLEKPKSEKPEESKLNPVYFDVTAPDYLLNPPKIQTPKLEIKKPTQVAQKILSKDTTETKAIEKSPKFETPKPEIKKTNQVAQKIFSNDRAVPKGVDHAQKPLIIEIPKQEKIDPSKPEKKSVRKKEAFKYIPVSKNGDELSNLPLETLRPVENTALKVSEISKSAPSEKLEVKSPTITILKREPGQNAAPKEVAGPQKAPKQPIAKKIFQTAKETFSKQHEKGKAPINELDGPKTKSREEKKPKKSTFGKISTIASNFVETPVLLSQFASKIETTTRTCLDLASGIMSCQIGNIELEQHIRSIPLSVPIKTVKIPADPAISRIDVQAIDKFVCAYVIMSEKIKDDYYQAEKKLQELILLNNTLKATLREEKGEKIYPDQESQELTVDYGPVYGPVINRAAPQNQIYYDVYGNINTITNNDYILVDTRFLEDSYRPGSNIRYVQFEMKQDSQEITIMAVASVNLKVVYLGGDDMRIRLEKFLKEIEVLETENSSLENEIREYRSKS